MADPSDKPLPSHKSLPTGVLDDILDEERAAAEREKALGPEFQRAAADLRKDMNLRTSQRLLDWDHLADEGEVGVADPEELKQRIEARFGAPSAPSAEPPPDANRAVRPEPSDALAPGSDTVADVHPLTGAVTLPAALPEDATQLTPRKREQRRRRGVLLLAGALAIGATLGVAALVGGSGSDGVQAAGSGEVMTAAAPSTSVAATRPLLEPTAAAKPLAAQDGGLGVDPAPPATVDETARPIKTAKPVAATSVPAGPPSALPKNTASNATPSANPERLND